MRQIENTLNGGFHGLYGEVVTHDCYRLKRLTFEPDLIFDIGANIGIFSRYARDVFPNAKIVAVEPDPGNAAHFRNFTPDPNTVLLEVAIGEGQLYYNPDAINGAHRCYLCEGLGYPQGSLESHPRFEPTSVMAISLSDVITRFWRPGSKAVLKLDCEGGENSIWAHAASVECLSRMRFLAMELHWFAATGKTYEHMGEVTRKVLDGLKTTHECEYNRPYFWATKKE